MVLNATEISIRGKQKQKQKQRSDALEGKEKVTPPSEYFFFSET